MNKTIKVFIASSEELKEERNELLAIEKRINKNLEQHGVKIEIVEWEFTDPAMSETCKQDDYNTELRSCDICCVICWQKFGKYTAEEFKTAREIKMNGGPLHKIYIFFKEPGEYTDELKAFKDDIEKNYGHFPSRFETLDNFRFTLYDILNREAIKWIKGGGDYEAGLENEGDDDDVQYPDAETASQVEAYTVRNSKIEINGEVLCDFLSMPFAKNNAQYQRVRLETDMLEQVQSVLQEVVVQQLDNEALNTKFQKLCEQLANKKNLLHSMECTLLKTYCGLVQFFTEHNSVRVRKAFKLFNQGDETAVSSTLDTGQINHDLDHCVGQLNEARKNLSDTIEEYLLKIKVIKANAGKEQNWAADCVELYRKAAAAARNNIPQADFAQLITDFAVFLQVNGQYDKKIKDAWYKEAEKLHTEARPIWKSLSVKDPEKYLQQEAFFLNKFAILQKKMKNNEGAVRLYTESIELYSKLAEKDESYLPMVAQVRGNRAVVYKIMEKYDLAEKEYKAVIDRYRQITLEYGSSFDKHFARNLFNLGILYKDTINKELGSLEKALEALDEAYQIRAELAENDPDTHQQYMASVLRTKAETFNAVKKYGKAHEIAGEAVSVFRCILKRQPFHAKTQRKLCLTLSEQALYAVRAGLYKEAENYARESMKLEAECKLFTEERAAPMKNLGYALLFQGKTEEAKEWIFKAAEKTKDNGKSWKDTIIKELGRFKKEKLVPESFYNDIDAIAEKIRKLLEIRLLFM